MVYYFGDQLNYWVNFFIVSAALLIHASVSAQIYQYTNDSGRKIYVDRLSKVPARYVSQLKEREGVAVKNSARKQELFDQENKALAKKLILNNTLVKLESTKQAISTNVVVGNNRVLVPVDIMRGYRTFRLNLLLDTGASVTVIHSDALPFFDKTFKKSSYARVAGGGKIKTWAYNVENLLFGPYELPGKQVTMIEHEGESDYDGLLGMDILSRSPYQIDFNNHKIIWDQDRYEQIEQEIVELKMQLK
jgi:hypothetical protein